LGCKLRPNRCRWLLLTTYRIRNLPTPYPTVPSPTLYDVPFSHDRPHFLTDDRQTDDTWHHKRDDRLKTKRCCASGRETDTIAAAAAAAAAAIKEQLLVIAGHR